MKKLMTPYYNLNLEETPFMASNQLAFPSCSEIPFKGDSETIERIRQRMSIY